MPSEPKETKMKSIKNLRYLMAVVGGFFVVQAHAQNYPLTIIPASPAPFESVQLQVAVRPNILAAGRPIVSMAGNKITVVADFVALPAPGGLPLTGSIPVGLGQLPAGLYTVEFKSSANATPPFDSTSFTVASAPNRVADYPGFNFSDLWWNSSEPGWGVSIHVKNDNFFAAWFVYDQNGKPQWYTLQAGAWSTTPASTITAQSISYVYTGKVVKATGPNFGGIDPLVGGVAATEAGTATIRFTSYDSAVFSGTVDGRAFSKNITRQMF